MAVFCVYDTPDGAYLRREAVDGWIEAARAVEAVRTRVELQAAFEQQRGLGASASRRAGSALTQR